MSAHFALCNAGLLVIQQQILKSAILINTSGPHYIFAFDCHN